MRTPTQALEPPLATGLCPTSRQVPESFRIRVPSPSAARLWTSITASTLAPTPSPTMNAPDISTSSSIRWGQRSSRFIPSAIRVNRRSISTSSAALNASLPSQQRPHGPDGQSASSGLGEHLQIPPSVRCVHAHGEMHAPEPATAVRSRIGTVDVLWITEVEAFVASGGRASSGHPPLALAYPNGLFHSRSRHAVVPAGYALHPAVYHMLGRA